MSAREMIRQHGGATVAEDEFLYRNWFRIGGSGVDTFWIVEATCTVGERAGSSSTFGHIHDRAEAVAQLRTLQAGPDGARYDRWELLKCEPALIQTVEAP